MRNYHEYARVVLTQGVLQKIRAEANRYWVRETGGPLVGYVDTKKSLVVVDASGPGSRARRKYDSVIIDGIAATAFCESWRKRSGAVVDYVGDWHSHVGAFNTPSTTDVQAMKAMAPFTTSPAYRPIAVIIARLSQKYAAFVLQQCKLKLLRTDIIDDESVTQLLRNVVAL